MRSRATAAFLGTLAFVACKTPASAPDPLDAGRGAPSGALAVDAGGCHSNADCSEDTYCEFTPGLCGKGKKAGKCRPRPTACNEAYSPVCGCDGRNYDDPCSAHAAGADLAVMGGCKENIANFAPCGRRYCDVRTSYCEVFLSDVFDLPTDYFCRPLPPACVPADGDARTCDCFPAGTRCLKFCGPLPTAPHAMSGFHLTCQGTLPPPN